MTKPKASDRSMQPNESAGEEQNFFFPKRNPPVSVRARSREEAEAKLDANSKEA
jgi:hypothetical protein